MNPLRKLMWHFDDACRKLYVRLDVERHMAQLNELVERVAPRRHVAAPTKIPASVKRMRPWEDREAS